MAYVVVHVAQGAADVMAISIEQATVVAGTDSKVITEVVPIWSNLDCAASDTLVARTAAVKLFLRTRVLKHKVVIFKIDPASLDVAMILIASQSKTVGHPMLLILLRPCITWLRNIRRQPHPVQL